MGAHDKLVSCLLVSVGKARENFPMVESEQTLDSEQEPIMSLSSLGLFG